MIFYEKLRMTYEDFMDNWTSVEMVHLNADDFEETVSVS